MDHRAQLSLLSSFALLLSACVEPLEPPSAVTDSAPITLSPSSPEGVPGFSENHFELDARLPEARYSICDAVMAADVVVFARVSALRFVSEHPWTSGHPVQCQDPVPAIELAFETERIFHGSIGSSFVVRLGADLQVSPPMQRDQAGKIVWEPLQGLSVEYPYRPLQVGQGIGMFLTSVGEVDGSEVWVLSRLGWFGIDQEEKLLQYPDGQSDFAERFAEEPLSAFSNRIAACPSRFDAESTARLEQAKERRRETIVTENRGFRPTCYNVEGAICADESCANPGVED
ncbi:MAG: hypothetical protein RBU37_13875 [Myxococcota bacterium]|jgi:hypothetical protein|nr:hypothetical protein [Myxococcota bacterium]